jgi:hypothetical protein
VLLAYLVLGWLVLGWLVLQLADVLVDDPELPTVWSKAVVALLFLSNPEPMLQLLAESEPRDLREPTVGHPWEAGRESISQDARFIDFMDRYAALEVWRELGPLEGCRAEGDSFSCGFKD